MKRLLFFPGHRMLAYEWEGGRFHRRLAFDPDEAGFAAFRAWLDEAPARPVQLLVDIIEEEFHVDHVPHVMGRDRADLYQRAATRRFRSTPYRYVARQGRQSTGRRDDEILVAGLTNPQLLQPWLEHIDAAGTPLRGIHSLPLVGQELVRRLGLARRRVLLVSQEVSSTARQSYYHHGRLRFSRLVPGRYEDVAGYAEFVEREIDQTIHYLGTQHLRGRDDPVDVVVLAAGEPDRDVLRAHLIDGDGIVFHVLTQAEAARRIGLRGERPDDYSDVLFAHALLRARLPANHYGLPRLRRHLFVRRGRLALAGLAAALAIAAAGVAGTAALRIEAHRDGIAEARERTRTFEQRYEARLRQLAEFDYRAVDVKEAVDLLDDIAFVGRLGPEPVMARVGDLLARHPNILLGRVDWQATRDSDFSAASARAGGRTSPVLASGGTGDPVRHHVFLSGAVVGFGGVYRTAVEYFDRFTADLEAHDAIDRVVVTQAPFDLEPDTGVSGDSGTGARDQQARRAAFAVALRLREVADEAQ